MASDLSELIQTGLSTTLESLLAKNTKLTNTGKTNPNNLSGECVHIESILTFNELTTTVQFFVPAITASNIFHCMMGEDIEPVDTVDDDTLDALNEVISNISGGLTTAINGADFEDLTNVQFKIGASQIINGEEHATSETLYRFKLLLEETELCIFIDFEENILPYIEKITTSPQIEIEVKEEKEAEEEAEEEKSEEEKSEETDEEKPKEESEEKSEETNAEPSEDKKDGDDEESEEELKGKLDGIKNFFKVDESLSEEEQKQEKLKKIIAIVSGLFAFVILVGIIMFFTGAFDPEVVEEVPLTKEQLIKKETTITIKTQPVKKYITFTMDQINPARINKRLKLLTKYEIIEDDALELIKAKEKERLYQEAQLKLENFAKNNKEESLSKDGKNVFAPGKMNVAVVKPDSLPMQKFIQIPTLNLNKYQQLIKQSKQIKVNLSICKDSDSRTLVFLGPFSNNATRDTMLQSVPKNLTKDLIRLNLTKKEFNEKCSF